MADPRLLAKPMAMDGGQRKNIIPNEGFWLSILNRKRIAFDTVAARELVDGQTVLITGAGGTIGQELVAACLDLGASQVIALDQHEGSLFRLRDRLSDNRLKVALGSVLDEALLDRVTMREPSILFHAAAVKHVGFAEQQPSIAAQVNVGGALAVTAACQSVSKAVLISTDKAAAPTTVMGMTKRVAEGVWQAWGTRGIALRPVNVIGSSGSVGETFLDRLQRGEPITVAPASRMFMTAAETAAFILEAAAAEPQTACIAYPDPAPEPIAIADLAERIKSRVGGGVIECCALTPGEKFAEDLRDDSEGLSMALTPRIGAVANLADRSLPELVMQAARLGNDRAVREILHREFGTRKAA